MRECEGQRPARIAKARVQAVQQCPQGAAHRRGADPPHLAVEQRPGRPPVRLDRRPDVQRGIGHGVKPAARLVTGNPPAREVVAVPGRLQLVGEHADIHLPQPPGLFGY